ncbi:dephospho-CoA kinase [candidate division KSB1 bacterium]|nr:dephospho-CoA kinase [candidate division KSB1 bacterium]
MLIVGLTGGIGTGKSVVSGFLKELGAEIANADKIANDITDCDESVIADIKRTFGENTYTHEGRLDRKTLGEIVFASESARMALNRIVHPVLIQTLEQKVEQVRSDSTPGLLIVEAALLYEMRIERLFDLIIVIISPVELVIKRLAKRDGLTRDAIVNRIRSQLPQEQKQMRADFVIRNDLDLNHLKSQVTRLYRRLISDARALH